ASNEYKDGQNQEKSEEKELLKGKQEKTTIVSEQSAREKKLKGIRKDKDEKVKKEVDDDEDIEKLEKEGRGSVNEDITQGENDAASVKMENVGTQQPWNKLKVEGDESERENTGLSSSRNLGMMEDDLARKLREYDGYTEDEYGMRENDGIEGGQMKMGRTTIPARQEYEDTDVMDEEKIDVASHDVDSVDELVRRRIMNQITSRYDTEYPRTGTQDSGVLPPIATGTLQRHRMVESAYDDRGMGETKIGTKIKTAGEVMDTELGSGGTRMANTLRSGDVQRAQQVHFPVQRLEGGNAADIEKPRGLGRSAPGVQEHKKAAVESNDTNKRAKKERKSFNVQGPNLRPLAPLNLKNAVSNLCRNQRRETIISGKKRKQEKMENGENVIVIQPGSRWLRIGLASDPIPHEIPHIVARKIKKKDAQENEKTEETEKAEKDEGQEQKQEQGQEQEAEKSDDKDQDQDTGNAEAESKKENGERDKKDKKGKVGGKDDIKVDEANDKENRVVELIDFLAEELRRSQRETKRKPVPNAISQVLAYNKSVLPEHINEHNDPYRVEWIDEAHSKERDVFYGEEVARLVNPDEFQVRMPFYRGVFNVEDYTSIEECLGDIQSIWEYAIEQVMGIPRSKLKEYYAMLVVPDIYMKGHVEALLRVLLNYMEFGAVAVHQSSVLVTFGAGVSSACVVDVGAQKTAIACVDDGYCLPDTRVNVKYGGDDITYFLNDLFVRSLFPYSELDLNKTYDWNLINLLKEKHVTLNLSDVSVRVYDFFMRKPNQPTLKYMFKVYDEPYFAPWCLFYPELVSAFSDLPDWNNSFACFPSWHVFDEQPSYSGEYLAACQFGKLPSVEVIDTSLGPAVVPTAAQPNENVDIVDVDMLKHPKNSTALKKDTSAAPTPPLDPVLAAADSSLVSAPTSVPDTPLAIKPTLPSNANTTAPQSTAVLNPTPPVDFPVYTRVYDHAAVNTLMPLDEAIAHSIAHAGTFDKIKKYYSSILLVGGGISHIPFISDFLQYRLYSASRKYSDGNDAETVEKIEMLPSPRDLDPKALAWKGGAVFSRLDITSELWITREEWDHVGVRLLRDRTLFQW
ncbi:putative actin-related protein 8, partial [Zancudomyces culisetae]